MEAPIIVGIVFLSCVAVVKIISDTVTRKKLIEKGLVDDRVRHIFGASELSVLSNLKWGMVLVGIGAAAFIGQFLPYRWSDEGTLGLILIFAGIAFLVYYPIAQSRLKKIEEKGNQSVR